MEVISKCISFLEDTHYRSQLGQKGEADSLCLFAGLGSVPRRHGYKMWLMHFPCTFQACSGLLPTSVSSPPPLPVLLSIDLLLPFCIWLLKA